MDSRVRYSLKRVDANRIVEDWRNDDNRYHNPLGPCYIKYFKNGLLEWAAWKDNGLSRQDSPAYYDKNGYRFFVDHVQYPFSKWIEIMKDTLGEERYQTLKAEYGNL